MSDGKCLFCGGDTSFLATIPGKVCLSCGDKLQVQGVFLSTAPPRISFPDSYPTLTQGERLVWAAAFARVIGEEPYGGSVGYKTSLADAHQLRRERAVSVADDAVMNLRRAALETVEDKDAVMLRAMLEEEST